MTDLHTSTPGGTVIVYLVKTCLHREYEATENTESEYTYKIDQMISFIGVMQLSKTVLYIL